MVSLYKKSGELFLTGKMQMNTDLSVCAPSAQGWAVINWSQVQRRVKKL